MIVRSSLIAVTVLGCASPVAPSGSDASPVATASVDQAAPSATALASAGRSRRPGRQPAAVGHIPCGEGACGKLELCCSFVDASTCVPLPPRASTHAKQDELRAACGAELVEQLDVVACRDSSDCMTGARCCAYSADSTWLTCQAMAKDDSEGLTRCDDGEVCTEGGPPCRTPGSRCIRSECVADSPKVRCGDKTCSASSPICCSVPGKPLACSASCEPGAMNFECITARDCPGGERCCGSPMGTFCDGYCSSNAWELCEKANDCPPTSIAAGAPRCKPAQFIEGFKTPLVKQCVYE